MSRPLPAASTATIPHRRAGTHPPAGGNARGACPRRGGATPRDAGIAGDPRISSGYNSTPRGSRGAINPAPPARRQPKDRRHGPSRHEPMARVGNGLAHRETRPCPGSGHRGQSATSGVDDHEQFPPTPASAPTPRPGRHRPDRRLDARSFQSWRTVGPTSPASSRTQRAASSASMAPETARNPGSLRSGWHGAIKSDRATTPSPEPGPHESAPHQA